MDQFQAAREGNLEWFKTNNYDIDALGGKLGSTVLMNASYGNHKELCLYLLSQGADVNARNKVGNTALIHSSGFLGDPNICSMLRSDPRDLGSRWEQVPISRGADVNIQNCRKTTALMASASCRNIDVCLLLLSKGADIELLDVLRRNALMLAALSGHINVCSLLISRGADIKYQNPDGYTVRNREDVVALLDELSGFPKTLRNHEDVVTLLDEFSGSPRTLKYCLLKTNPETSIKALLCWNDYQKEIKCYL